MIIVIYVTIYLVNYDHKYYNTLLVNIVIVYAAEVKFEIDNIMRGPTINKPSITA